jgi:CyaY protein
MEQEKRGHQDQPRTPRGLRPMRARLRASRGYTACAKNQHAKFYPAMSSPPAHPLTDTEFHRLAETVLAAVEADADRWLQQDLVDIDTHRTGGLLELAFEDRSKIVINTQPPLHELWLASRSAGFHFRFDGQAWVDTRDGTPFHEVLSREAGLQAGQVLRFTTPSLAA